MKLLVNLCAQDGIISHNSGVGTIVKRYIKVIDELLTENKIDYHINLFTPEYHQDGFGYSKSTYEENSNINHTIIEVSNGTNGKKFFGNIDNWKIISKNVSEIINNINFEKYDKVITILNDPTFNEVLSSTKSPSNHIKILIPHSTAKIYGIDKNINRDTKIRIDWEQAAFNYINENENCYVVATGMSIRNHLIDEYNCKKRKTLNIINGEIIDKETKYQEIPTMKKLFSKFSNHDGIVISFGRPEEYKNLIFTMKLGKELKMKTIVITQEYFKGMEIIKEYKKEAKKDKTLLYINEHFDFPQYVLKNFQGKIIVVVPSKKEIVGLIINEVRKMNKDNILIVANDIQPFRDQIDDGVDGLLIDTNNIKDSALKIKKYLDDNLIKNMNRKAQKRLVKNFDLKKNINIVLKKILR